MLVLVTGANGKVGSATVTALLKRGHEVRATISSAAPSSAPSRASPTTLRPTSPMPATHMRWSAASTQCSHGRHSRPRPQPAPCGVRQQPHDHVQHSRGRGARGLPRFVNTSSETVPGFFFAERKFLPDYVPVDEEHPIRPQDPYASLSTSASS